VRGGSWSDYPQDCRASNRNGGGPEFGYNIVAFRLARSSK
jgi:formylglycine-generating enzyme required for sulfatase activity